MLYIGNSVIRLILSLVFVLGGAHNWCLLSLLERFWKGTAIHSNFRAWHMNKDYIHFKYLILH